MNLRFRYFDRYVAASNKIYCKTTAHDTVFRRLPTPVRDGRLLCEVWKGGLDLSEVEEITKKLPQHLQREAAVDLQRRIQPVVTEWLQRWDTDDGELEPEEPLSDEEDEADETPSKRPNASTFAGKTVFLAMFPFAVWNVILFHRRRLRL